MILRLLKRVLLGLAGFIVGSVALLFVLQMMPLPDNPVASDPGPFLIQNVAVVDVRSGKVNEAMDVVIANGRIKRVSSHQQFMRNIDSTDGITQLEGKGKFLVPGFWDMHTHSWKHSPMLHHSLYIASGVTSVRDMSGCLDKDDPFWACAKDRLQWNFEVQNDDRISPRYVEQSSYQINGGNEVPASAPEHFHLRTEDDAKKVVRHYQGSDVTMLKSYSQLSREQYFNLSKAARQQGLRVAGHRPLVISLSEAIDNKQASIEHARLFLFECHNKAQSFRSAKNPLLLFNADYMLASIQHRDRLLCQRLMKKMAESNTAWTPTLTTLAMASNAKHTPQLHRSRMRQIPWLVEQLWWGPDLQNSVSKGLGVDGQYAPTPYLMQAQADVVQANESGVTILIGTDTTDTHTFAGASFHDEMKMYSDSGISNIDILKMATYEAANYAGLETDFGTVEEGKVADLVLLEGDPTLNISHTQDIAGVFLNGRYLGKQKLTALKDHVDNVATSVRINSHLLWSMLASPLWRRQLID